MYLWEYFHEIYDKEQRRKKLKALANQPSKFEEIAKRFNAWLPLCPEVKWDVDSIIEWNIGRMSPWVEWDYHWLNWWWQKEGAIFDNYNAWLPELDKN